MSTRIPKSELLTLKRTVPLAALVGERVALQKRGKDLVGLCPFHDDDTPSLVVTDDKHLWRCFGCEAGGSAIDWVMRTDGLDFLAAATKLKERYLPSTSAAPAKKLLEALHPSMSDSEALDVLAAYYACCFDVFDDGRGYLAGRGISADTTRRFGIGFAGSSLSADLPLSSSRSELRRHLQRLGVLRSTGHEHLRGCVVVPLEGEAGVVGFYGRRIDVRDTLAKHLYLPGPHRGVFNRRAYTAPSSSSSSSVKELVLCEAIIDALSFLEQGVDNVTSSYGTQGFTDEMEGLLVEHKIERVLCAYDGDAAGDAGFVALRERLARRHIEVVRVPVPPGLDVNDCAQGREPLRSLLAATLSQRKAVTSIDNDDEQPPPPSAVSSSAAVAVPAGPVTPARAPSQGLVEAGDDEAVFVFGDRRYRVRGLAKLLRTEALKVQVVASRNDLIHPDTLDLFVAKARMAFAVGAAADLGIDVNVTRQDVAHIFAGVDQLRHERRAAAMAPKSVVLTDQQKSEALALLRSPQLLQRIVDDFASCGVVGEETNKLVAFLGATSRKLQKPLAVMVQSSSAAGKSSLMDAVLAFIPDEDKVVLSAMTGQALFYLESDMRHKVLAIAEEEGAESAALPLKLLQSDGKLKLLSPGKDPNSGRIVTLVYEVTGPVALLSTTTAIEVDEELLNRCIVLTVDESRAQTRRIHEMQRELETLEGLQRKQQRAAVIELHQNAQRLLEPVVVVNPFAKDLTFVDEKTRSRRDHAKFLALIWVIALLHSTSARGRYWTTARPTSRRRATTSPSPNGLGARCWPARSTSCRPRRASCSRTSWR